MTEGYVEDAYFKCPVFFFHFLRSLVTILNIFLASMAPKQTTGYL